MLATGKEKFKTLEIYQQKSFINLRLHSQNSSVQVISGGFQLGSQSVGWFIFFRDFWYIGSEGSNIGSTSYGSRTVNFWNLVPSKINYLL